MRYCVYVHVYASSMVYAHVQKNELELSKDALEFPIRRPCGHQPIAMVGLPPGVRSGRAQCAATAVLHPGSASCTLSEDIGKMVVLPGSASCKLRPASMVVIHVALLRFIMEFIYLNNANVSHSCCARSCCSVGRSQV